MQEPPLLNRIDHQKSLLAPLADSQQSSVKVKIVAQDRRWTIGQDQNTLRNKSLQFVTDTSVSCQTSATYSYLHFFAVRCSILALLLPNTSKDQWTSVANTCVDRDLRPKQTDADRLRHHASAVYRSRTMDK